MKIGVSELKAPREVEVRGDEPWLAKIYGDFPSAAAEPPRIRGRLTVTPEAGGTYFVSGTLAFDPFVPCSRCAKEVPIALAVEVAHRFYPETESPDAAGNFKRERNLSKDDLDAFYLADDAVDLELLVNDLIHGEVPERYVPAAPDGSHCTVCHVDLKGVQVYGEAGERQSPLAQALKGVKAKH